MCGIAGWLLAPGTELSSDVLTDLGAAIRHRGPDDVGEFCDPSAGLALVHRRLSIIDLSSAGHQPMIHPDTGDVLVFNGEIYNFRDLRVVLENQGCRFRSSSDTEVLLQGLALWGLRHCLGRVRGMYAFAWWRASRRVLYLVRDPLGIKPLYYCNPPGRTGLVFASEIKAFLKLPGFSRRVDRRSIGQFLEFGYTFDEQNTIFAAVHKLPPGNILEVRDGVSRQPERFFDPQLSIDESLTGNDWETYLYDTLCQVVTEHLISDVPVGLLLSGGLDSSLLAALAARLTQVDTFCMGFTDSTIDERSQAREVARFIGANHHEIMIAPNELTSELEDLAYHLDDLFADWGTFSTLRLYRRSRSFGIKVVIVGEGSDELFGGYDLFRSSLLRTPTDWWLFRLYRNYAGRRYGRYFLAFRHRMLEYLATTGGDRFAAIRLFESRDQLPNNYVMKVDKASMAASVEARVPFLDQRVAEIAYQIPARYLIFQNTEKYLLRRIAARYNLLPSHTIQQRKFGASIAASWMDDTESFRRYAHSIILAPGGWTEAMGFTRAMSGYFHQNRPGYRFPHGIGIFRNLAWRLLTLELWSKAYGVSTGDS